MNDRIERLTDGRKAPVLRIERNGGVTLDGEPLPLIVADEGIDVRTESDHGAVLVRLTFLAWGPVIVDMRDDEERTTTVKVEPRSDVAHALEDVDQGNARGDYL